MWDVFQAAGLGVLAYGLAVPVKKPSDAARIVPIVYGRSVGVAGRF